MRAPQFTAHPWHGIEHGTEAPSSVTAFIEIVPTDTVKFEIHKPSGYLTIDRPQKYSNYAPCLYGFIPRTYSGELVGSFCAQALKKKTMKGDGDPLDICVFTERSILAGNILVKTRPVGGLRVIDKDEADDKIIAVLEQDDVFSGVRDVTDLPAGLVDRLRHYFLTYKEIPGSSDTRKIQVTETYGLKVAHRVIEESIKDYNNSYGVPS